MVGQLAWSLCSRNARSRKEEEGAARCPWETESALLLVWDMHERGKTIRKSVDERAVNYGAFGSQIGH